MLDTGSAAVIDGVASGVAKLIASWWFVLFPLFKLLFFRDLVKLKRFFPRASEREVHIS